MTTGRSALEKLKKQGYLTLTGFSQLVGISLPVIIRLANSGKIADVRVGGQRRIYAEAMLEYIESSRGNDSYVDTRIREALKPFIEGDAYD